MLSTDSQILYLPLRDPAFVNSDESSDHNCTDPPVLEPQRLPLGQFGDIRTISYDPLSEKVFWIDRAKGTVNWGFLNGSQRETLRTFDMIDPRSMVYDWNSGNIFWMETSDVQIDVLTFDGRGSGVMLEHNPNGPQFWLPNSLAVDSKNRYIVFICKCIIRTKYCIICLSVFACMYVCVCVCIYVNVVAKFVWHGSDAL